MVNIINEISKYLIIFLIAAYTYECFSVFGLHDEETKKSILLRQNVLMFMIHFICFGILYLRSMDIKIAIFYGAQVLLLLATIILYVLIYPNSSRLVINNMCMLIAIGFIMLTRLDQDEAIRQFMYVTVCIAGSLFIPVIIRKVRQLSNWRIFYAVLGLGALVSVAVLGATVGGAKLNFNVGPLTIQPSELVKIVFVFFVASSFKSAATFKQVVITTAIAAIHVLTLVASTDLGSALIIYIVYLVMLYVASKQPLYTILGLGAGAVGAMLAYKLFNHVQIRVAVWQDPIATYHQRGLQIAQSLFAIGTGSWFGMGLTQGAPKTIPLASTDLVFSAISEELGLIFALCLILIYVSCYIMFLNIAMQLRNQFYKLVALGLGTCYIFQVFLTIGGAAKFIPFTGVTLPLISFGGSSVLSTLIMFAIIQGLYIVREDEEDQIEREKIRQESTKRSRETAFLPGGRGPR